MCASMVCLSLLKLSNSVAMSAALASSSQVNNSVPCFDLPNLPPALIRGPNLNPKS